MPYVGSTANGAGLYSTSLIPSGGSFTIFVRMNILSFPADQTQEEVIFTIDVAPSTDRIWLYGLDGNLSNLLSLWDSQSNTDHTASNTHLSIGHPHSFCVTTTLGAPGVTKLYYDGVLIETGQAGSSTPNLLTIGNTYETMLGDNGLNAEFSELRVWQAVLSAGDAAAEHASSVPVRSSNLFAFYPIGSDLSDYSGNGKPDLTQVGADAFGGVVSRATKITARL